MLTLEALKPGFGYSPSIYLLIVTKTNAKIYDTECENMSEVQTHSFIIGAKVKEILYVSHFLRVTT